MTYQVARVSDLSVRQGDSYSIKWRSARENHSTNERRPGIHQMRRDDLFERFAELDIGRLFIGTLIICLTARIQRTKAAAAADLGPLE